MAFKVGDLFATLRVDDSQFRAGVRRTDAELKKLAASSNKFNMQELMGLKRVERERALMLTNMQRRRAAFARTNTVQMRSLSQLSQSANKGRVSIGRLGESMGSAMRQILGLHPLVGQLAVSLGAFGIGSALTVGVLGGISAIGLAWRALTKDIKEFNKSSEEAVAALVKLGSQARNKTLGDLLSRQATDRVELGFKRTERSLLTSERERLALRFPEGSGTLRHIDREIVELDNTIVRMERGLERLAESIEEERRRIAGDPDPRLSTSAGQRADTIAFANQQTAIQQNIARQRRDRARFPGLFSAGPDGAPGIRFATPFSPGYQDNRNEFQKAVDDFGRGVKSFGKGVEGVIKGAFSAEGTAQIGATLASNAIGFVTNKVLSGLQNIFSGGMSDLEKALEKNTRALQAGTKFLGDRLSGAGLATVAPAVAEALEFAIGRILTGDPTVFRGKDPQELAAFVDELSKRGVALSDALKIAEVLGLELRFTVEGMAQFSDQVHSAIAGLDDLGEEARKTGESLRNVPDGFKIALAQFNATQGVPVSGVGNTHPIGMRGDVVVNQTINIDAKSMTANELRETLDRETRRAMVRGTNTFVHRGLTRR